MSLMKPQHIQNIAELHSLLGLHGPEHPLISVINVETVKRSFEKKPASLIFDFYAIALKHNSGGKFTYGQEHYDVKEGIMFFLAPGQVFIPPAAAEEQMSGWALYVHPDFLWGTSLAGSIKRYEYFDYVVNEALFLSEKEEGIIVGVMQQIQMEYFTNIDKFSQDIIISQVETLLNYADRFYYRQFLTRKIESHQILDRLEAFLASYFNNADLITRGLPNVQYVSEKLNLSANYLSSLLRILTGRNLQQHIQDKMIEKAKEKIANTELSVSEISYKFGFEHPQSFSRMFKAKTGITPLAFRKAFN